MSLTFAYRFEAQFLARRMCHFVPVRNTSGWKLYEDVPKKPGWISSSKEHVEELTFEIPVGKGDYEVYVSFLRSYTGMGRFRAVIEQKDGTKSQKFIDSSWDRKRSTVEEELVGGCKGAANLTLQALPSSTNNKVKIIAFRVMNVSEAGLSLCLCAAKLSLSFCRQ